MESRPKTGFGEFRARNNLCGDNKISITEISVTHKKFLNLNSNALGVVKIVYCSLLKVLHKHMLIVAISGEDVASVSIKEIYQIVTDAW